MNFIIIFIAMSNIMHWIFLSFASKAAFYLIPSIFCGYKFFIKYASAYVSNELNFENITENDPVAQSVQVAGVNETTDGTNYPLRLTDGLYGIGAWSQRIEEEVIFIGYEDDDTLDFTSWIASPGSLGCNESHYENVEKHKQGDGDTFIGMYFITFEGFLSFSRLNLNITNPL